MSQIPPIPPRSPSSQYPNDDEIRKRAHQIWKARVRTGKSGSPAEDWQRAIEELQVERQSKWIERHWWMTGFPATKGLDRLTGIIIPFFVFGIVPIIVVLLTLWNSNQQQQIALDNRKQDLEIADEKQKDDVLKNYFETMRSLLLDQDKPLRKSKDEDESRSIARTLTLTTLRQLEPIRTDRKIGASNERKRLIIQFLYESNLINKTSKTKKTSTFPIVYLGGANLRGANLKEIYLIGADLRGTDLSGANLGGAYLNETYLRGVNLDRTNLGAANLGGAYLGVAYLGGANLSGANLSGANLGGAYLGGVNLRGTDLREADLSGANLSGADLSGADLSGANLSGTDLSSTQDLTQQQLEGSNSPLLCNVALPKKLTSKPHSINPNRDCKKFVNQVKQK